MQNVNGHELFKVECSSLWGVLRPGEVKGGLVFKTKRAALAWIKAQTA